MPNYNPNNEFHQKLIKSVKPLIGAIGTPRDYGESYLIAFLIFIKKEYVAKLKKAGFKINIETNLSVNGLQAPLIEKVDSFYNRIFRMMKVCGKLKILPNHFEKLLAKLTQDGKSFVEADRLRLITTSYYIVAEK